MTASARQTIYRMIVQCAVVLVAVLLPALAPTANASDTAFPSTTTTFSSSVSPTASLIEGPVSVDVPPVVELTVGAARATVEELGLVLTGGVRGRKS